MSNKGSAHDFSIFAYSMVKKVNFSASLVLFLLLTSVVFAGTPADSLLEELDRTLEKRGEFLKKKQDRIVAIKKQYPNGVYNDKVALRSRYAVSELWRQSFAGDGLWLRNSFEYRSPGPGRSRRRVS